MIIDFLNDFVCCYHDFHQTCFNLDKTNFVELIPLCHEYQVTWLLKSMEKKLVGKPNLLPTAVGLLLAERYDLTRYKDKLICTYDGYSSLRRSDLKSFHSISKSLRYQLAKETFNVKNQNQHEIHTIFQVLDDYIEK